MGDMSLAALKNGSVMIGYPCDDNSGTLGIIMFDVFMIKDVTDKDIESIINTGDLTNRKFYDLGCYVEIPIDNVEYVAVLKEDLMFGDDNE